MGKTRLAELRDGPLAPSLKLGRRVKTLPNPEDTPPSEIDGENEPLKTYFKPWQISRTPKYKLSVNRSCSESTAIGRFRECG